MCYEFSQWSWKLRSTELARKHREAEKVCTKEPGSEEGVKPPAPAPSTQEEEKVPA